MADRKYPREYIAKELDEYLANLSKKLTKEANWRQPVKKTEASKYLAQLLNKKSTLRLKKKGKNIIDMDLVWD